MPKLIANLRESILQNAKRALLEQGYDSLTIRNVARDCGIAVGTMYNYFPSKSMLVAAVMLEDWLSALEGMRSVAAEEDLPGTLAVLYEGVCRFTDIYQHVWAGYSFSDSEKSAFSRRHRLLVRQLAECLRPALARCRMGEDEGMDIFLAENVLICASSSELQFDTLLGIVARILP